MKTTSTLTNRFSQYSVQKTVQKCSHSKSRQMACPTQGRFHGSYGNLVPRNCAWNKERDDVNAGLFLLPKTLSQVIHSAQYP